MDVEARGRRMLAVFCLVTSGAGCSGELTAQVSPVDGGSAIAPDSAGPNPARDVAPGGTGVVIGPVDFTKAPMDLPLQCERDVGHLAFKMPCKVGMNLAVGSQGLGTHETECSLAGSNDSPVWSFLLPLAQISEHPSVPLRFPGDLPSPPVMGTAIDVGGESFTLSIAEGTLSFTQIDPPGRAFIARIDAKFEWTGSLGSSFACDVAGLLWGAPGSFL
jgi:hypothetical protein